MNPENRNMILAITLSMAVLFGWQMFVVGPELEKEAAMQQVIAEQEAATAAASAAIAGNGGGFGGGRLRSGNGPATRSGAAATGWRCWTWRRTTATCRRPRGRSRTYWTVARATASRRSA